MNRDAKKWVRYSIIHYQFYGTVLISLHNCNKLFEFVVFFQWIFKDVEILIYTYLISKSGTLEIYQNSHFLLKINRDGAFN